MIMAHRICLLWFGPRFALHVSSQYVGLANNSSNSVKMIWSAQFGCA